MSFQKVSKQLGELSNTWQQMKRLVKEPNITNLHAIPGVKKRVLKARYKNIPGSIRGDIIKIENDDTLKPTEKGAKIAELTMYNKLKEDINEFLQSGKQLKLERVMRDSEVDTVKNDKEATSLTISYTDGKRISYARYPFTKEYRDPNQWDKQTREATDVIHIGSHKLFRRYAVTSVNVLGKNTPAGRKGTPLEGLGYEPIGIVPKHTGSPDDYKIFIRVTYPSRLVSHYGPGGPFTSQTDKYVTLKGRARHPVYTTFLGDNSLSAPLIGDMSAAQSSFGVALVDLYAGAFLDMFEKDP